MTNLINRFRRAALAVGAPAIILMLSAAPAIAQAVSSADVAEDELTSFTMALEDVIEIQGAMQAELEGAAADAQQEIRQTFNAQLVEAIESHDIEVPRFNAIAGSLEQDAELSQRVGVKRRELAEMEAGG